MWKKLLGNGALALVAVCGLGFAYLYFRSPEIARPSDFKIESTAARLVRGKELYHGIGACGDCHSQRDFRRFGGPVVQGREGVGFVFHWNLDFRALSLHQTSRQTRKPVLAIGQTER